MSNVISKGKVPKPQYLKAISGTERPDRIETEVLQFPAMQDVPIPPKWLDADAARFWYDTSRILVDSGALTESSLGMFAMLCSLHSVIIKDFEKGFVPETKVLAQYRAYSNDFGLSPLSKGKVRPAEKPKEKNPFATNGKKQA